MEHPKVRKFEIRLKEMFDTIDDYLEDKYGREYPLHPARAKRNSTANKEQNGLFTVGSAFSTGYGSQWGRGYVIDVDLVTLAHIPLEVQRKIEKDVMLLVNEKLPHYFPERALGVKKDGRVIKIVGDFTLGSV